jgi:hypothetical protein
MPHLVKSAAQMEHTMNRPKVTPELIATVAAAFCSSHSWDASQADDLARAYRSGMDGYELAKALDTYHGWMPTADDVASLDCFGSDVREAHRQACIAWARDNNIQPPLPIGTMTTRGEITGISEWDGATYLIRENGCTQASRRLLVRFEDAAVGAA